jgi:hypothetical protein
MRFPFPILVLSNPGDCSIARSNLTGAEIGQISSRVSAAIANFLAAGL